MTPRCKLGYWGTMANEHGADGHPAREKWYKALRRTRPERDWCGRLHLDEVSERVIPTGAW